MGLTNVLANLFTSKTVKLHNKNVMDALCYCTNAEYTLLTEMKQKSFQIWIQVINLKKIATYYMYMQFKF